nr:lipoyl(octanoyl) transferase [Pseudomonadota bacterium]
MLLQVVEREGLEDFEKTLAVQNNLLEAKITDPTLPDYLILVEHQSVYTVGRSVEKQDIQTDSIRDSAGNKVKWIEIGRGGKATFHGPGQLVAYPIFDLTQHGKDVHVFLR